MTREARQEAQLDHATNHALQHRVAGAARHQAVEDFHVAVDENALPRHRYVIEDGERILFVETRTEWPIEFAAAIIVGFAANELESRRIHWQREAKRIRLFAWAARIERPHP